VPDSRQLRLISWPFHNGLPGISMGAGAARLAHDAELRRGLDGSGWEVVDEEIEPVATSDAEITRVMELVRRLSARVASAVDAGAFPLVLAGNCNSSLGTVAGAGATDLGVVWFDAHADFDTPEDSTSGSLDAMGLALLTGRGWGALRETVPGLSAIDDEHVVLVAVRDLEPGQRDRLRSSRIHCLEGNGFSEADLDVSLDVLRSRVGRVYLHIDLDSLDPSEGNANQYAAPQGLSCGRLLAAVTAVFDRFTVAAAAITAYNPDADGDGRMAVTATRVLAAVAERAVRPAG
jgi:arginase